MCGGHTCEANFNVLVLLLHHVGLGIELGLSGLAPGAFTWWAILLALHFQRLPTKQGWFKHIYKHRFIDNCKRTCRNRPLSLLTVDFDSILTIKKRTWLTQWGKIFTNHLFHGLYMADHGQSTCKMLMKGKSGTGEMGSVLPEDPGSIPLTHMAAYNCL